VVITDVEQGGLAWRAGLRPGEVIVAVAGKPVASLADLTAATTDEQLQSGLRLTVQRQGVTRFVLIRKG